MTTGSGSAESEAQRYISNPRFHRTFTLPATAEHGDLTFGYADVGREPGPAEGPEPSTILFMPGMFASRYLGIAMHAIAEKLGVRLLVVDRPGLGKSSDVPLGQRIPIWVELVHQLLEHLGVRHLALVSHSAGAMYLLNTLHQCRGILHPDRPFVALLAPWADPSISRVKTMQIAQYLPVSAFSVWHLIPSFFVLKAGPAFASSGAMFNKSSGFIAGFGGDKEQNWMETNRAKVESAYGISRDLQVGVEEAMLKDMFGGKTTGANDEALQCLRKGPDWSWVKADNYATCIREVLGHEKIERRQDGDTGLNAKLKVRTYFAEEDALVGKRGQEYMEQCWKGTSDGEFDDVLDYESTTVPGSDHDTVMQSLDVLESVFIHAGGIKDS